MRARTYIDHVDNAGHFYELAAEVLGRSDVDLGPEAYVRAKGFMEMSTLALDLAREVRLCEAAAMAQERALMAERERAEKAAGKRGGAKTAQGKAAKKEATETVAEALAYNLEDY